MDWNALAGVLLASGIGLIVGLPLLKHLLDWHERSYRWFWASAHETGHAFVLRTACRTTLAFEAIVSKPQDGGYGCRHHFVTGTYGGVGAWALMAYYLGGMAAETVKSGRINCYPGCLTDYQKALGLADEMIRRDCPAFELIHDYVADVTVPLPAWRKVTKKAAELTVDQQDVLNLGYRLAVKLIRDDRVRFDRAWTLVRSSDCFQDVILTAAELDGCLAAP